MDLVHYDPPLPELPLLRGLALGGGEEPAPRFDWAACVIRLAQAVAERERGGHDADVPPRDAAARAARGAPDGDLRDAARARRVQRRVL